MTHAKIFHRIKWVHENIASFGGDPSKIVIWGHSSGAEAIDMYNFAWPNDTLVSGLIMNSGTAIIEDAFGSPPRYSNFSYVAAKVGCGYTKSDAKELECMKGIDADVLTELLAREYNEGVTPALAFGAAVDEEIVFENHAEKMLQGRFLKVVSTRPTSRTKIQIHAHHFQPAIIGLTTNDGTIFAPYPSNNGTDIDTSIADYFFTSVFLCPAHKTATLRASHNIPTYRFVFAGNFSNISPRPWMGAYHSSELPLLFGTHGNFRGASTQYQNAVSEAMQDAWRAFADDPWGGLEKLDWPQYHDGQEVVRLFGYEGEVAVNRLSALKELEMQC